MITYIKIDGFKSFRDFEMNFTPFTVIAGANGSGKTNLFDALRLLSDLASLNIKEAFTNQRGEAKELFTQYDKGSYATQMSFEVDLLVNKTITDEWGGEASLKYTRLKYKLVINRETSELGVDELRVAEESLEKIKSAEDKWMKQNIPPKLQNGWRPKATGGRAQPYIHTVLKNGQPTITIPQDGGKGGGRASRAHTVERTALSGIIEVNFPHAFAAREEIKSWRFLELNPEDLRAPTKKAIGFSDRITQSGKNIAAALYRITVKDETILEDISRRMYNFFEQLPEVKVVDDTANNQFVLSLQTRDGKEYTSRVLSEGTLRLLALLVYLYDPQHRTMLCFEEPENGIHPGRLKELVRLLSELSVDFTEPDSKPRQLLVNTHSPGLTGIALDLAKSNDTISVWLASMARRPTVFQDGTRTVLNITTIRPVVEEYGRQRNLFADIEIPDNVKRYTRAQMRSYLGANSDSAEQAAKAL